MSRMGDLCGAVQPDAKFPFVCTRPAGHDGPHEAVLDPQFGLFDGLGAVWNGPR
jgi:hypothetical protein